MHTFYGFTITGDDVFCREAYETVESLLAHLENAGDPTRQTWFVA
jgi:hypothetical protein